jgi:hypothetical protein
VWREMVRRSGSSEFWPHQDLFFIFLVRRYSVGWAPLMRTQVVRGPWDGAQPEVDIRILKASGVGQYSWRAALMAAPRWCEAFPELSCCGLAGLWLVNAFSTIQSARATYCGTEHSTYSRSTLAHTPGDYSARFLATFASDTCRFDLSALRRDCIRKNMDSRSRSVLE